jgi:hypothetical protein
MKPVNMKKYKSKPSAMQFSPCGKYIVVATEQNFERTDDNDDPYPALLPIFIDIWSWTDKKVLRTITIKSKSSVYDNYKKITSLSFGKHSDVLMIGFSYGSIGVINSLLEGNIVYLDCKYTLEHVSSLCFKPDYKTFVSSGGVPANGHICVWNESTKDNIQTWTTNTIVYRPEKVRHVEFNANGNLLLSFSVNTIYVCDFQKLEPILILDGCYAHFCSKSNNILLMNMDQDIQLWDYDKKESLTLFQETEFVKINKQYFNVSPDFSKFVFYVNKQENHKMNSYLEMWDLKTAASLHSMHIGKRKYGDDFYQLTYSDVDNIVFSRDSSTIVFNLDLYLFYTMFPASVDKILDLMSQKNIPPEIALKMFTNYISNNKPSKKLVSKTYKRALSNRRSRSRSRSKSRSKSRSRSSSKSNTK